MTNVSTDWGFHVFHPTRDDHPQYAKSDGTRAFTGGVTVSSGGAQITGNSKVTGTFEVTGDTKLDSTVETTGLITASGGISLPAWTPYTPVFSSSNSDASAGNATSNASYILLGKTLHVRIQWTVGSTTVGGTGFWMWGLPSGVTAKIANQLLTAVEVAASGWYGYAFVTGALTGVSLALPTASNNVAMTSVTATVPFNQATGNFIDIQGTIEVA